MVLGMGCFLREMRRQGKALVNYLSVKIMKNDKKTQNYCPFPLIRTDIFGFMPERSKRCSKREQASSDQGTHGRSSMRDVVQPMTCRFLEFFTGCWCEKYVDFRSDDGGSECYENMDSDLKHVVHEALAISSPQSVPYKKKCTRSFEAN